MAVPYVRVAQLEIDPAHLDGFAAAIREEIEASVRVEAGVLALHAVAEKDDLSRVLVLEIYADPEAYAAHLETPHFKRFKAATQGMVKSLTLLDAVPLVLAAKATGGS